MTGTSVLAQFRTWLRANCPLIDKNDKFNANYIGAAATEYTIRTAGDRHRYDILGKDSPTYNLTFEARLPFGAAVAANIDAADRRLPDHKNDSLQRGAHQSGRCRDRPVSAANFP